MFVEQLGKNDIRKLVIKLGFGRYIRHELNKETGTLDVCFRTRLYSEGEKPLWVEDVIGLDDYGTAPDEFKAVLNEFGIKDYRKFMYEKFGLKYAETFLLGSEG